MAVQALNGATVSIAATPATGLKAGDTVSLASTITGLGAGRNIASPDAWAWWTAAASRWRLKRRQHGQWQLCPVWRGQLHGAGADDG